MLHHPLAGPHEVWAYGFRNPWRASFDSITGDLYVSDVGQNDVEEVDIISKGGNYGWPVKEGTFLFETDRPDRAGEGFVYANSPNVPAGLIDPIASTTMQTTRTLPRTRAWITGRRRWAAMSTTDKRYPLFAVYMSLVIIQARVPRLPATCGRCVEITSVFSNST